MPYALLADAVLLIHGCFVLFVVFGGALCWFSLRWLWLHLPALVWGVVLEWSGWICPLTPLEGSLRRLARQEGIAPGVIEPYLLPLLYPVGLTRDTQWKLAAGLVLINILIYGLVWWRYQRHQIPPSPR